jgi:HK97 family phage prohead protease
VSLEERGDGLWGTFRVFGTNAGDQALTLVDEGLLTGLSISGLPKRSGRAPDGTVIRQRVHLDEVSLCDAPAYVGAEVTVRRCTRVELELPDLPDDEQLERLRAVGIVIGR